MKQNILVPSVGESVTQGTLAAWLKGEGQSVQEGEELFELETDKATVAVPAPASGVLHIQVEAGRDVQIGAVVGVVETVPQMPQIAGVAAPQIAGSTAPQVSPLARRVIAERGLEAGRIAGTGPGGRITKEDALRAVQRRRARQGSRGMPARSPLLAARKRRRRERPPSRRSLTSAPAGPGFRPRRSAGASAKHGSP